MQYSNVMNLCFSHLLNKSPAADCIFLYKIVFTKTNCPFILLDHSIAFPVLTFLLVITGLMFFLCFRVSNYFLKPAFIVYFDILNLLSTHPTLKTPTCFGLIFASKFKHSTFFLSEFVIFGKYVLQSMLLYGQCVLSHLFVMDSL